MGVHGERGNVLWEADRVRGKMCCRETCLQGEGLQERSKARETEARESARGNQKREEIQKRAKVHEYFFVQRK